jgi:hypothetical protein
VPSPTAAAFRTPVASIASTLTAPGGSNPPNSIGSSLNPIRIG